MLSTQTRIYPKISVQKYIASRLCMQMKTADIFEESLHSRAWKIDCHKAQTRGLLRNRNLGTAFNFRLVRNFPHSAAAVSALRMHLCSSLCTLPDARLDIEKCNVKNGWITLTYKLDKLGYIVAASKHGLMNLTSFFVSFLLMDNEQA